MTQADKKKFANLLANFVDKIWDEDCSKCKMNIHSKERPYICETEACEVLYTLYEIFMKG